MCSAYECTQGNRKDVWRLSNFQGATRVLEVTPTQFFRHPQAIHTWLFQSQIFIRRSINNNKIYVHRLEWDAILFFQMVATFLFNYLGCRTLAHAH